jgi:hypothetical protein
MVRAAPCNRVALRAFAEAVRGVAWVLWTRRVVPPRVEAALRALDHDKMTSRARRYG